MIRKLYLGLASTWAEGLLLRSNLWILREFYARTGLRMLPCVLYRTAIVVVIRLTYSIPIRYVGRRILTSRAGLLH